MTSSTTLIGTEEAAALLEVDRATVTRWAKAGRLKVFTKTPGIRGVYLFERPVIAELVETRRRAS